METQGGTSSTEAGGGDGQSGQAASTALIEKILSEEPRWQGIIEFSFTNLGGISYYVLQNHSVHQCPY